MRYYVRRVGVESIARLGCLLGWLIALLPSLGLAWLAVNLLQRVYVALQQFKPVTVNVLGQELVRLDFLQLLQLQPVQARIAPAAQDAVMTFLVLAAVLMLAGGVLWAVTLVLAGLFYNLLARFGFGLSLELDEPSQRHSPRS